VRQWELPPKVEALSRVDGTGAVAGAGTVGDTAARMSYLVAAGRGRGQQRCVRYLF